MCPSDGMVAPTMCSSPQNWFQKQENEISQQPQKFQKQCGISQTLTKAARKKHPLTHCPNVYHCFIHRSVTLLLQPGRNHFHGVLHGGFLEWRYPSTFHFHGIVHFKLFKQSILGVQLWKHIFSGIQATLKSCLKGRLADGETQPFGQCPRPSSFTLIALMHQGFHDWLIDSMG